MLLNVATNCGSLTGIHNSLKSDIAAQSDKTAYERLHNTLARVYINPLESTVIPTVSCYIKPVTDKAKTVTLELGMSAVCRYKLIILFWNYFKHFYTF